MRRVVVSGLGVVSPLGNDPQTLFAELMAGRSGIARLPSAVAESLSVHCAAPCAFDAAAHFGKLKRAALDRFSQMALIAAAQAVADAGLDAGTVSGERAGVCLGTGAGGVATIEEGYRELFRCDPVRVKPATVLMAMNNAAAAQLAIDYGLRGPCLTYSTACASSALAVGEACRMIRHGYVDRMLAGGAEALLNLGTIKAWEALRALATDDPDDIARSCKPFARDRCGLVLGEGAALLVLEEAEAAVRRGARIHGEIIGYGSSCDAEHLTRPSVAGQARTMAMALEDAGIAPGEVDYINAHGTATPLGDVAETRAIREVFGEAADRIPVSSTKSMHGHLMGAASALEFVIALLAIAHQAVPPTAHLVHPDPECDLDYVPGTGRRGVPVRTVMSNAFAFGGTNAVLVARAFP